MRYKKDLTVFLNTHLLDMIEDHLECWKDHYYRMSVEDVLDDLNINYDFTGDIEYIQIELERDLTLDEQSYFLSRFKKAMKENYYKRGYKW